MAQFRSRVCQFRTPRSSFSTPDLLSAAYIALGIAFAMEEFVTTRLGSRISEKSFIREKPDHADRI